MIPFQKLSAEGPILHLAHANAYPFGCYHSFLKSFTDSHRVIGMSARPMWNNESNFSLKNWKIFSSDLIQFFEEQQLENTVGIGHSMGAISSLLAAQKKQNMFSKLIMIDPVILPPKFYFSMRLPYFMKRRMNPMIKIALRRKDEWSTKKEAISYLKSKKVFQRFHEDSFKDFVKNGLKEENGKIRLAYSKEWEAMVYSSVSNVWPILKKPPCPIIIIRAEYSNVMNDDTWSKIKSTATNCEFINFKGAGHLIPMEKPYELAELIMTKL